MRRWAVEIYTGLFVLFAAVTVVAIIVSAKAGQPSRLWMLIPLGPSLVFFQLSLIAADIRQRRVDE